MCSAARRLKLTAHLLQPLRRILASRTDISWWFAEIKEQLFMRCLSLFLLFTPSISSSAPVFSCSVSSYCLQSCAGCCCGFSFRVVFKMADSNNSTLTKRTGGFFYSWTCCEDACARSHTHTSTLERGTLMCFDDGELILFISHCRSKPADETGI